MSTRSRLTPLVLSLCALTWTGAGAATPEANALRARHQALAGELAHNDFQRPIHLQSSEQSGDLQGEVFAVVEHPFATLDAALKTADRWCDILILHPNVKQCRAVGESPARQLAVRVGRKLDQPAEDAFPIDFRHRVVSDTADYLQVRLNAGAGPMGTHDYRILVEATPLDASRSFLHLSYAYGYGFAARVAMQGYLATAGSGKVGFSVVDRKPDGSPVLVDNVRGAIERNTMRYYLAIDAYLDSLSAPPQEQTERRLRDWFAATERYPRQLRELDQAQYLAIKRKEIQRQQVAKAG
ncbi:MAG TPA: hypothetical protein VF169_25105 [Albitalea sp.]|uniref:hypothetical protein n=1 Tax=Piscinibacter sp. TaxID=1903157 RepID=UPI002ED441E4